MITLKKNAHRLTATIVAPTGVEHRIEISIPSNEHTTERNAEYRTTLLNVLITRIALNAGKIINAEINKDPTRFIARTIITAITIAISRL